VDPSSLIFLAIIAIWAAYLLGHWVRRRDQLATARSIDRFSDAMRVLERRTPTRPVTSARPTARAYVVAPVRAPATGRPASGPHLAARTDGVPAHLPRPSITRAAARRRARLVLGLAVATVLAWALAATAALTWWPAAVVTALLAAVVVQMRRTARPASAARAATTPRAASTARAASTTARAASRPTSARSATRRPTAQRRHPLRRPRGLASRVPGPSRRVRHHQDVRAIVEQVSAARRAQDTVTIATTGAVAGDTSTADAGHDLALSEPTSLAVGVAEPAPRGDGSWQPVPVPPPTYTLKPKARPVVRRPVADVVDDLSATGAATSVGTSARTGADVLPEVSAGPAAPTAPPAFDLDEILERRIASGS
jgi:hypothetical protein